MAKLRKTLGGLESPYIISLMDLIPTQSKATIVNWSLDYVETRLLPIYEAAYPDDTRPRDTIEVARAWMAGAVKLPVAKKLILATHSAAREAESNPAAQAAVRAIGQAASTIHAPGHCLAIAFYGAAAIAYARVGLEEKPAIYDAIAAEACAEMEAALRAIAVENEPNPAKINWYSC